MITLHAKDLRLATELWAELGAEPAGPASATSCSNKLSLRAWASSAIKA
jgi:hypothetical protein